MNEILTVRAPKDLKNDILKASKENGITMNAQVLVILKNWLDAERKK